MIGNLADHGNYIYNTILDFRTHFHNSTVSCNKLLGRHCKRCCSNIDLFCSIKPWENYDSTRPFDSDHLTETKYNQSIKFSKLFHEYKIRDWRGQCKANIA